ISSGPALSGSLAPELEATVRAEIAGAVLQTSVEAGQSVPKGTIMARIDDTALRDNYISAQSEVRTAEQSVQVARRNAERAASLAQAGAIADRDLEQANWNATNAASQLASARARLALAQEQVSRTRVRAPFAGIISEKSVNAGDVVQPGVEMFTVVDPSSMRLEASVPAEELGALRVGAPVTFTVSGYPGRTFEGKVSRINPTADPATRQVRILVSLPNANRTLVAGLFAEGRVSSETREGLVAPMSAVDIRGLRPTVVRLRGGRVERAEVQLGLRDEAAEAVEISAGVAAGDTLLLGAAQGISQGTRVRVGVVADRPTAQR
ncbi:MAG TPA: efflux RND transporter periplasmic adaptor subunit, partial [Gemmatimonadaceae bacterium]|nr:efflux RND transporter periplasmic adaptor subunit [Gemmatimonadaceae bacterium]